MNIRKPSFPIQELFIKRWSPRALSGETISYSELMSLFEAARWAPSAYNNQPWRFIYGRKGTVHWDKLFDLLVPFNQTWCKDGAVLVLILSHTLFSFNRQFSRTHSFDTGAAWENMCLQATSMGLVVHGMEGFDYDRARAEFGIPEEYMIEAMCVIGRPGRREELPQDLAERETPSDRRPLEDLVYEGCFKNQCV